MGNRSNRALKTKFEKANRQRLGIYKTVPRFAIDAVGDFRPVEAGKLCYVNAPDGDDTALIAAFVGKIKTYPAGLNSSGRVVRCDERKRGGCDPRTRGELTPGTPQRYGSRCFVKPEHATRVDRR
jgi:hypothetical protein